MSEVVFFVSYFVLKLGDDLFIVYEMVFVFISVEIDYMNEVVFFVKVVIGDFVLQFKDLDFIVVIMDV